jgi:hypothetical protein
MHSNITNPTSLYSSLYMQNEPYAGRGIAKVLATAEDALKRIIETYSETDVTFTDISLRTIVQNGSFDLLHDFSEACRAETDFLRVKQLERRHTKSRIASLTHGHERPTSCS